MDRNLYNLKWWRYVFVALEILHSLHLSLIVLV